MKSAFVVLPLITACAAALAQSPAPPSARATAVDRAIATTQGGAPGFRGKVPGSLIRDVDTQQVPELFPGEIEDVGPQFLVARPEAAKPGPVMFNGFVDTQMFYTSNALLSEKGNQDTGVMVITAQAAFYLPPMELAGGILTARAGYRQQWWLYSLDDTSSQLNNFDFTLASVFIGIRHTWDEKWVATANLDYNRYLSADNNWSEFYTELVPNWSLERNIPIGETAQLSIGYYGGYHFTYTDPQPTSNINDRLDNAIGITYTQELIPKLFLQPYYRLQWSHYTENSDRNDMYNDLGVSLVYMFNQWASVRGFVNFESRDSTDDTVSDYQVWNSGGGVTFSAQF